MTAEGWSLDESSEVVSSDEVPSREELSSLDEPFVEVDDPLESESDDDEDEAAAV